MSSGKLLIFLILMCLFHVRIVAQTSELDSLESQLQLHTKPDSAKVDLLLSIAIRQMEADPNKAINNAKSANIFAQDLLYKRGLAKCYHILGTSFYYKSNFDSAIFYYDKSLRINQELDELDRIAADYNNIGLMFFYKSDNYKAIENYQKALVLRKKTGDKKAEANLYNNIGMIYESIHENQKALNYYFQSLKIKEQNGYTVGISKLLNNIGVVYKSIGEYSKALEYYQRSLLLKRESGNQHGISTSLNNIGYVYIMLDDFENASIYLNQAINTTGVDDNEMHLCKPYTSIGYIYFKNKDLEEALLYTNKALKIAKNLDLLDDQVLIYKQLSDIFLAMQNYKEAYFNHYTFKVLSDSILNSETIKSITRIEEEYKYNRELQNKKIEQERKDTLSEKRLSLQKMIRNLFIAGFFIAIIIVMLSIRIILISRRNNKVLQLKNAEIIRQKNEIIAQKNEIQAQATELLKHKENLESIIKDRTAQLIIEKERAEESDRLKTAFLNNISHEFRTPMNAISGFANLLIQPDISANTKLEYTEIIDKSCIQLTNIVNDTVELSKVHTKQAIVVRQKVNISLVISRAIQDFESTIKQKCIIVKQELNLSDDELTLETDKFKIERIFWHLINNAVKFTKKGSITITSKLVEGKYIQFQIEDTGIGIPKNFQEKIFYPFMQVESGITKNYRGSGIGLSLVKAFVEMIGGRMWLVSELEIGTSVFFTVPINN